MADVSDSILDNDQSLVVAEGLEILYVSLFFFYFLDDDASCQISKFCH